MKSKSQTVNISLITIVLLLVAGLFWQYIETRQEIKNLNQQVTNLTITENDILSSRFDPVASEVDTSSWSLATNTQYFFSINYPTGWTTNTTGEFITLKRFTQTSDGIGPLALTISSNLEPSASWRQITLLSGETAYYEFADGFDHYYMPNGNTMLIWSVPARSYDGLYTEQELQEAIQIINTYRAQ